MLVSSRVNDARVAQQIGGIVVLPIVGGASYILLGRFFMETVHVVFTATFLSFVLVLAFLTTLELFEGESILTRWK
jgi:hypothetical protein